MQLSDTSMQIQQSVLLYQEETGRRGVPLQNMTLEGLQNWPVSQIQITGKLSDTLL